MSSRRRFIGRVCRVLDALPGSESPRSRLEVERSFLETPDRIIATATAPLHPESWVLVEEDGVASLVALPGTARAKIYALTARQRLDPIHSDAAMTEARLLATEPGIDDPALTDLTHLPFVTIDEESSRDLDQALCIQRAGADFVVWYAIADAAWFVRPGSALFQEALERGATLYLPGLVVPLEHRVCPKSS